MNNEIKLKNIQVVLFFKNEINYNALELANNISKKLPQLGQPSVFNLSNDIPNEIRVKTPRILFSNTKELSATISALNASLNIIGESTSSEIKDLVDLIYEELLNQNIQTKSIGIISQYVCFDIDFNIIKNKYYKDELSESELVNSSWFTKKEDLNVWKLLEVQEENDKKILNITCDLNNRGNEDVIDIDALNKIIEVAKETSEEFREKIKRELGE